MNNDGGPELAAQDWRLVVGLFILLMAVPTGMALWWWLA